MEEYILTFPFSVHTMEEMKGSLLEYKVLVLERGLKNHKQIHY